MNFRREKKRGAVDAVSRLSGRHFRHVHKNKKNVLNLKERRIFAFFRMHGKKIAATSAVVVLFIGILGYWFSGSAKIAYFYPSSCLGGWENPQNAQGIPDLKSGANADEFIRENSAVLPGDSSGQIFCGGFQGEPLDGMDVVRGVLRFSISTKEKTLPEPPVFVEEIKDDVILESDAVEVQDLESGENIIPDTSENISPDIFIQEPEEIPSLEEIVPIEGGETQSNIFSRVLSFLYPISLAHAEDEDVLFNEIGEENIVSDYMGENIVDGDSANTGDIDEKLWEIFYTFDGKEWISLAKIGKGEWYDFSVEIPEFRLQNLATFQVGIQRIFSPEEISDLYLDGMILEVEYESSENGYITLPLEYTNPNFSSGEILDIKSAEGFTVVKTNLEGIQLILFLEDERAIFLAKNIPIKSDIPFGIKGNRIFWGTEENEIRSFDVEEKKFVSFSDVQENLNGGLIFEFSNSPWRAILRDGEIYFWSNITGEVFSDDDSGIKEIFRQNHLNSLPLTREDILHIYPEFNSEIIQNE